jgi:hypothetical protein
MPSRPKTAFLSLRPRGPPVEIAYFERFLSAVACFVCHPNLYLSFPKGICVSPESPRLHLEENRSKDVPFEMMRV